MAEWLKAISPLSDRPIVDETGLKGRYDVTMDISMQDVVAAARSMGANVPPPAAGGRRPRSRAARFSPRSSRWG